MFRKWKRDLNRIYNDQLLDLLVNVEIFRQFGAATKKHVGSRRGADLAKWMQQGYVAFAGTAIRRLLEHPASSPKPKVCPNCGFVPPTKKPKPERSVSLVILLRELQQNAHLLTRKRFCSQYKGVASRFAGRDFDSIARRKGATHITADRIERDIQSLERAARPVRRLVNKVIAHTERDRRRIGRPKYKHIDAAVKAILTAFKRYRLLVDQRDFDPSDALQLAHADADFAKIWP
jgi:hypothetical protein